MIAIASVPILIGTGGRSGLAAALVDGYRPAMLTLAGLCVAGAVVTALFVSDARTGASRTPRMAPPAPHRSGALPIVNASLVKEEA